MAYPIQVYYKTVQ